jgi:hypothetical protein
LNTNVRLRQRPKAHAASQMPALRPRALPLNLQLRQERNQGMRAHLHHRGKVELDERLALIGRELEFVGEGRRIG